MYTVPTMVALLGASAVAAGNVSATTANACASVSALSAASAQASATRIAVPASLAHDCLQSVPIDQRNATRLVNSYQQFYQFQSSLAFIKNPPASYQMPAADIDGELNAIKGKIGKGVYKGEYDFQLALYTVVVRVRDDHTEYLPDLLSDVFKFPMAVPLSSVSRDGVELPKIYVPDDLRPGRNQSDPVSAVISINGQNVITYLEGLASWQRGQDHDSNYNAVLSDIIAVASAGVDYSFTGYPGPTTTLKFDNGTTRIFHNTAIVVGDLTGADSGTALYSRFCVSNAALELGDSKLSNALELPPPPSGYPAAVVRHSQNLVAGYFLDGNYSDVAVLRIESSNPVGTGDIWAQVREFQILVEDFLARCRTDGKVRLIVDVQSNMGGLREPVYDLFKQLFPTTHPYEASVMRASPAITAIARINHEIYQGKFGSNGIIASNFYWIYLMTFNISRYVAADGTNFGSLESFLGGAKVNGDTFTALAKGKLTTPAGPFFSINITGYGRPARYSEPPFAVENMIILSNGVCASACNLFLEQTGTELGMNFVAVGGRPRHAPMTAVGRTKGGDSLFYFALNQTIAFFNLALSGAPDELKAFTDVVSPDMYALERASKVSLPPRVNVRSNVRHHDESGVPTHFLYDEAQCRMFKTAPDLFDATGLWKRVADAAFRNASVCSPTKGASNGAGVPLARRPRPSHLSGKSTVSGASNSTATAGRL